MSSLRGSAQLGITNEWSWPQGVMRPKAEIDAAAEPTAGSGYMLAC